jgi:uncharacterized protein YkwD
VPTVSPSRHRGSRHGTPPNQPPRGRRRRLLWCLPVVLVLAAGGFYLMRGSTPAAQRPAAASQRPAPTATACGPAATGACAVSSPMNIAVAQVPSSAVRTPASHRSPQPTPSSSPSASHTPSPSASAPSSSVGSSPGTAATEVLDLINQARASAGLHALTFTGGLDTSAARHNATMEAGCGLSHQCPGEAALGNRETAAGVNWTSAGENIGEGGPVASTTSAIAQMAVTLTQDMLNEKPPDDGHRQNILSTSFTHIGVAVSIGSNGDVWMTQDFSN